MTAAEARLRAIIDAEWEGRMRDLGHEPYGADAVDEFLPDVTDARWQARAIAWQETLAAIEAIEPAALDDRARVDRAVYLDQLRTLVAQVEHRLHERPANSDSAFWSEYAARARRSLRSSAEADRCIAQLRELPRWFGEHIANMRAGLARGFAPPGVTMRGREAPVRAIAAATSAAETPYLAQFEALPGDADARRERVRVATEVIEQLVIPAHRELLAFLEQEYLPGLPTVLGACEGPGGHDFYAAQLREFTTTGLSAEEIHELGLREVAAITDEMAEIARQAGHASPQGMLQAMREDPAQYATSARQLLAEAALHAKRFDAVVHRWFGGVPRQRFAIIEPSADIAPYYTFGRGGLEAYTLNTYDLPSRPLYSLPALTLHEAAPGHCFQIALAHEADALPAFRRDVYISAYGEGWALYTERLGVEMGMYDTPVELMGMLSFQVGSSRVDLQACKLEYSIVSPK